MKLLKANAGTLGPYRLLSLALGVMLGTWAACTEPPIDSVSVPRGEHQYEVRIHGFGAHPDDVQEAFGEKARAVCERDSRPDFHILEVYQEPKIINPVFDMPEGAYQSLLARNHIEPRVGDMDALIACGPAPAAQPSPASSPNRGTASVP